jgi:hypothetical protein
MIDKLEIVKRATVRRAKLYILRDKVAREIKRIIRRSEQVSIATKGGAELEEERKIAEAKQKEIDDAQAALEQAQAKKLEAEQAAKKEAAESADQSGSKEKATEDVSSEASAKEEK